MKVDVTTTLADLQAALRAYCQPKFPDAEIENVYVQSYDKTVIFVECDVADGLVITQEIRHRVR